MEQRPSRESNTSPAKKEISLILWKPNVHYRNHNSPPLVPIVSQINTVHAPSQSYFLQTNFNIIPSLQHNKIKTTVILADV
jgi:hypothetical protein